MRIGITEVTIRQFRSFADATGYQTLVEKKAIDGAKATYSNPGHPISDHSPAANVTWDDAAAFCNWLSTQEELEPCYRPDVDTWVPIPEKNGYRLPTEAEWEYACRAGTTSMFSFGDDHEELGKYAWTDKNSNKRSHEVGSLLPNPFGLFDVHGNLNEFCQDSDAKDWYARSPRFDPISPVVKSARIIRGGSWSAYSNGSRSAARGLTPPTKNSGNWIGFRIVRVLIETQNKPKAKVNVEDPNFEFPEIDEPPVAFKPTPIGNVQLTASDQVPSFTGLLNDPPALPGVKRWNVETRYARGHGGACWSPDSKNIAAVSGRQLRIYEAPEMKLVRILPEHTDWIGEIAWSPDGKWLASVDDTVIRLHDAVTGKPFSVLKGHANSIEQLAWSADSLHLASGGSAEAVHLWSTNGKLIDTLAISGSVNLQLLAHPRRNILIGRREPTLRSGIWKRRIIGEPSDFLAKEHQSPL